jgi:hypothetical protein
MKGKRIALVTALLAFGLYTTQSYALLIGGPDIIAAPASVIDDAPGAENTHQQAFNERQDVLLMADLGVDGGVISSGTVVNSHMIFLNTPVGTGTTSDLGIEWLFDGDILGVMSNSSGSLEAASNSFLGAAGTVYPGAFAARGMEGGDSYIVLGNMITVNMIVSEPGDWIRVVTASAVDVPEPSTLALFGLGLLGFGFKRKSV